jgi:hypothetical protein
VDPVSRTTYRPGELAQCDLWFPEADIPLGYGQTGRPPVLVMVSGYSRVIAARMLPSRRTGDLIDGHWRLLTGWGAVPRMLGWDNEAGIGKGRVTSEFAAFAGLPATKIYLCRPRDPEAKGLVERANGKTTGKKPAAKKRVTSSSGTSRSQSLRSLTKAELYEKATKAGIRDRSSMNHNELADALAADSR